MKILQRYILRELLLPFILCLVTLNFIFMAGYLVRAAHFIIGRGVPLGETLYVLMLAMPGMIGYTVPTSILTAIMIVFGNLSQKNELRAMQASGIHLFHILLPAFIVGIVLSFTMFVFNDQVASNARFALRKTTKQLVIKNPNALIEAGRFVKISDNIIFMAKETEEGTLKDIVAYEVEDSEKPIRTIIAERGEIISNQESGEIEVRLYNGSISDNQEEGVQAMQFKTYVFPTLGQEDIRKMQKKKKDLTLAEIVIHMEKPNLSKDDRIELSTTFHQRIAFACGSFIFVFIGTPIAMLVRRGEIVVSFGIAMAAASLYYIFFVGAKTVAIQGYLPPFIVLWIPNLLLVGFGVYLLRKALAV